MPELPPLPQPYPYLRAGYFGGQPLHPGIGEHIDLSQVRGAEALAAELRKGLDYAVFETQGEELLSGQQLEVLTALESEGVPTLLNARKESDLVSELAAVVSHVVSEGDLHGETVAQCGLERSFELQQTVDRLQVFLGGSEQSAASDPEFFSPENIAQRRELIRSSSPRAQTDRLIGFLGMLPEPEPLVTVVIISRRAENLDYSLQSLLRQDYSRLDPLLVIDPMYESEARQSTQDWDIPLRIEVAQPRSTLGDRLNLGVQYAYGEVMTVFEESALYGTHHITDLVHALQCSGAHLVGKASWLDLAPEADRPRVKAPRLQHAWDQVPATGTITLHRSTAKAVGFSRRARGVNWALSQKVLEAGGKTFSIHAHDTVMLRKDQTMEGLDRQVKQTESFGTGSSNIPTGKNN